jgi:NADH:ubiquinone oxidoreductase subunit
MSKLARLLGVLSNAGIRLLTFKQGILVGTDQIGNRYFKGRKIGPLGRERRWVMYVAEPEATTVPPEWHGWLHHQMKELPDQATAKFRKPWQKPPLANMTGTDQAYRPPGHLLRGGTRDKATGDYQAWTPDN